jgi:hypothetical protein
MKAFGRVIKGLILPEVAKVITFAGIIDKNFLFVRGTIINAVLYVKKILTTRCGLLHR